MSKDACKEIEALHETFNRLVPEGAVSFNMARERIWYDWLKWRIDPPFNLQDLIAVIGYRRSLIQRKQQFPACLKFSYMIGRPDTFEEDLSMATHRLPKKTDRDRVLEMTGRSTEKVKPVQLAKDIIASEMAKLRKTLL